MVAAAAAAVRRLESWTMIYEDEQDKDMKDKEKDEPKYHKTFFWLLYLYCISMNISWQDWQGQLGEEELPRSGQGPPPGKSLSFTFFKRI